MEACIGFHAVELYHWRQESDMKQLVLIWWWGGKNLNTHSHAL